MDPPPTELELVDALSQRMRDRGLLPPPSQPFTVHDDVNIFNHNPSYLYDKYGGGADCVYFICNQLSYQDGWKVAAGTQEILDGSDAMVGLKDTLVFHESRWLPRTRWTMDEFMARHQEGFNWFFDSKRLYRLHRPA